MIRKLRRRFGVDAHMSEVLSGAKIALLLRILGAGLSFAFNAVIARLLGAEGAGLYFMALSVTMISGFVGRLGLENAMLRFVARGAAQGDWKAVWGVFAKGMRWALMATVAIALFWVLTAPWASMLLFDEPALVGLLQVMAFAIVSLSLATLLASCLTGLKQIGIATAVRTAIHPLIGLVVIWQYVAAFGIEGVALAYLTGTVVASIIGWLFWRRAMRVRMQNRPVTGSAFDTLELWASARPLWATSVITRGFMPWAPLVVLSSFASTADVGIFGVASRISLLLSFLLTAVNSVLAPKFVELHSQGDIVGMGRVARRFAGLLSLITIPITCAIFFFGDHIMGAFGEDFRRGGTILAILAAGQAYSTICGSVFIALNMSGCERDVRNITLVSAAAILVGCAALIPVYGLIGAALTVTLSVIVNNTLGLIQVWQRLGIIIMPIPFTKTLSRPRDPG